MKNNCRFFVCFFADFVHRLTSFEPRDYRLVFVIQNKKRRTAGFFVFNDYLSSCLIKTFLHHVRLPQFGHFKYLVVPICIAFSAWV